MYSLRFGFGYALLFCLPKVLPVTFMGVYLVKTTNRFLNYFGYLTVVVASIAVPFFLVSQYLKIPMETFFQVYNWYYPALIEWAFCFMLCWLLCYLMTNHSFFSTVFASQVIVLGGFLYEIPTTNFLLNTNLYFSTFYPLFIATLWFCLAFTIYLMKEQKWHPTKLFYILLTIYVGYSVFYIFNPYYNIWLPRLPTILLLATLPLGFQKEKYLWCIHHWKYPKSTSGSIVEDVWRIFNETPIRQGRGFVHYGVSLSEVAKRYGSIDKVKEWHYPETRYCILCERKEQHLFGSKWKQQTI